MEQNEKENRLESKVWYQRLKFIGLGVLIFSFFAPLFKNVNSFAGVRWVIDGLVNVCIWAVILILIRYIIVYTVSGDKGNAEGVLHKRRAIRLLKIILWGILAVLVFALLSLIALFYPTLSM